MIDNCGRSLLLLWPKRTWMACTTGSDASTRQAGQRWQQSTRWSKHWISEHICFLLFFNYLLFTSIYSLFFLLITFVSKKYKTNDLRHAAVTWRGVSLVWSSNLTLQPAFVKCQSHHLWRPIQINNNRSLNNVKKMISTIKLMNWSVNTQAINNIFQQTNSTN